MSMIESHAITVYQLFIIEPRAVVSFVATNINRCRSGPLLFFLVLGAKGNLHETYSSEQPNPSIPNSSYKVHDF